MCDKRPVLDHGCPTWKTRLLCYVSQWNRSDYGSCQSSIVSNFLFWSWHANAQIYWSRKQEKSKAGMSILSFYVGKCFFLVLEILHVGFWIWFFKGKSYRNFPMWNCDNRAQLMRKRPLTMYLRVQAIMRSRWSYDSFVWGKYFSYLTEFKKPYLSP